MAVAPKPCGAETFSHITKLIGMTRLLYGVHCGTTILRSVYKAVQGVEQPFDFTDYCLHLLTWFLGYIVVQLVEGIGKDEPLHIHDSELRVVE